MSTERKGYAVTVPEIEIGKNLEADVVVIGGGASGLPAALTALEEGAKSVIVLEKRFATGGDGLRCNHIFAVGSPLQKEVGSTLSRESFVNMNLEGHNCDRVNPNIIRSLVYKSADTIRWLQEEGVELALWVRGRDPNPDPKTATTHVTPEYTKSLPGLCSTGKVFRHLTQRAADAGVQFLVRTSGKKILRGADGEVTGVVAQKRGGQEIEIKTNAVILCTGSFVGNKELLKKYFPDRYIDDYYSDALLTNTGDGLPIAEEAGAAMAEYCTTMRHGGTPPTVVNVQGPGGVVIGSAIRVNKEGQRFFAENYTTALQEMQYKQSGKISYSLFDDKMVQSAVGRRTGGQSPRVPTPPEKLLDPRQFLQKFAKREEWAKMSDSWDEISNWIGCDPKVLKATVDRYNSFCDRENDEDFGKDKEYLVPLRTPPYYATRSGVNIVETIGPVIVNENMEVLDKKNNNPIPGFFAAGVITSGWTACEYHVTGMAGRALSYSLSAGRIAGENAAKYVMGK